MTDQEAIDLLEKVVITDEGMFVQINPNASVKLRIITAECVSPRCRELQRTAAIRALQAKYDGTTPPNLPEHDESVHPATSHEHFVVHDVRGVEVISDDGIGNIKVRAHTAEGDWCQGMAAAVLKRCTEASIVQNVVMAGPTPQSPRPMGLWARLFGGN